jgi:hypothetical protein
MMLFDTSLTNLSAPPEIRNRHRNGILQMVYRRYRRLP